RIPNHAERRPPCSRAPGGPPKARNRPTREGVERAREDAKRAPGPGSRNPPAREGGPAGSLAQSSVVVFSAAVLAAVLAAVFFAVVFLAAAVVFFAAVFLAAVAFFAGAFLAAVFFVVFFAAFLAGPLARFSASSSKPRSGVISSTLSPERRVALVSPSVTYGPKRPSLTTTGFSLTGSVPSSFSGGLAAARPRCLGWA